MSFLLGATYEAEEGQNLFTIGGEYGHAFTRRIGVAAAFEHLNDVGAWVFVFPVSYRLYQGLTVAVGPGFERTSRRGGEHDGPAPGELGADDNGADNLFLFRLGLFYKFEVGERYTIAPGMAYDWVDEEHGTAKAFVYGVKFGIGF